ncbi:MAG: hypothetical protein QME89_00895, partial [Actinomycetota bacterium]|nr:hypothetical protein [Actinomycetota bacterium]
QQNASEEEENEEGQCIRHPAVFDRERLDWLNGKHLRRMPLDELVKVAGAYAPRWSRHPLFPVMVESVLDNITNLGELPRYLEAYGDPAEPEERAAEWLRGEVAGRVLEKAAEIVGEEEIQDLEHAHRVVSRLRHAFDEHDLKPREILMPLRVALTGRDRGPALPYLLYVLGREECLHRLQGVRS